MADDGSFSVYEEKPEAAEPAAGMPGMEASAEMQGVDMSGAMPTAGAQGQPAASLDEALELARHLLSPAGADQASMQQGFNASMAEQ